MSSEYGWTDQQIGDLPLARFRQITAAIQLRRYAQYREDNYRFSWLARTLSSFIAAGYMVEGENKALDHAKTLSMDDIESALLGSANAATSAPAQSNANGSFEKFMGMMGNGGRRPGT